MRLSWQMNRSLQPIHTLHLSIHRISFQIHLCSDLLSARIPVRNSQDSSFLHCHTHGLHRKFCHLRDILFLHDTFYSIHLQRIKSLLLLLIHSYFQTFYNSFLLFIGFVFIYQKIPQSAHPYMQEYLRLLHIP